MSDPSTLKIEYVCLSGTMGSVFGGMFGGVRGKFRIVDPSTQPPTVVIESPEVRSYLLDIEGVPNNTNLEMTTYGRNRELDREYDRLIAAASSAGYVPARTNANGWITLLILGNGAGFNSNSSSTNPSHGDLLKQLENLWRAGVISDAEFATKTSEILQRPLPFEE